MRNVFIYIALLITSCLSAQTSNWILSKEEKGVKVFTRLPQGSNFLEYKAETIVNAPSDSLLNLLRQFDKYPEWIHSFKNTRILSKTDTAVKFYTVIDSPWPVTDRDVIISFKENKNHANGIIICSINKFENNSKLRSDLVRLPVFKGYWKIIPLKENKSKIVNQVHAEPGGSVPSWVANYMMVDGPVHTLTGMRNILIGNK